MRKRKVLLIFLMCVFPEIAVFFFQSFISDKLAQIPYFCKSFILIIHQVGDNTAHLIELGIQVMYFKCFSLCHGCASQC